MPSRDFWKLFRQLPVDIRRSTRASYALFRLNPAHPGLKLERLRAHPSLWSVRVSQCYRAVAFRTIKDSTPHYEWIWVGTHAQFNQKFPY